VRGHVPAYLVYRLFFFINLITSVLIGLFLSTEKIVQGLLFIPKWADEHILFYITVLDVPLPHLYEYRCVFIFAVA
jgi:phenolic acid decarboxylase